MFETGWRALGGWSDAGCVSTGLCHVRCIQEMGRITCVNRWSLFWTRAPTRRLGRKDGLWAESPVASGAQSHAPICVCVCGCFDARAV